MNYDCNLEKTKKRWKQFFPKAFLLIFVFISPFLVKAQLLGSAALDTMKVYRSLDKALKEPEKVYILDLNKEKLKDFPLEILQLKNLNVLLLQKNKFKEIPDTIQNLTYLQELDLSRNKLTEIPVGITKLQHLKSLTLNRNQIEALPPEFGNLSELQYLDMWSNNLSEFPRELSKLEKLKTFDLRVISYNSDEQKYIQKLLPETEILFSNSCNCH